MCVCCPVLLLGVNALTLPGSVSTVRSVARLWLRLQLLSLSHYLPSPSLSVSLFILPPLLAVSRCALYAATPPAALAGSSLWPQHLFSISIATPRAAPTAAAPTAAAAAPKQAAATSLAATIGIRHKA